ncbi:MAG: hypothetical protein KQH53_03520 [Desulfarculaceae bacterium]|nr:hypothetical protein [Desulfarculaceae bacterium]
MLDLHTHVLPGLDDGAKDWDEALAMCRLAVADGVRLIAATPHWYPAQNPPERSEVLAKLERLQGMVAAEGLELKLVPGAEVALDAELGEMARQGLLPTLGSGRALLLECPPHTSPRILPELVYSLRLAGLRPVLAHPERTWSGTKDWDWLAGLVEQGCLVQLTGSSLTGDMGSAPKAAAQELVARGLAGLVASDAHSADWRPPTLSAAAAELARLAGDEAARVLTVEAPAALLSGAEPPPPPLPKPRRNFFFWRR